MGTFAEVSLDQPNWQAGIYVPDPVREHVWHETAQFIILNSSFIISPLPLDIPARSSIRSPILERQIKMASMTPGSKTRVAVLMGGPSPERDVSLETGRNICKRLDRSKYEVVPVEITRDRLWIVHDDNWLTAGPHLSDLVRAGAAPGEGLSRQLAGKDAGAGCSIGRSIGDVLEGAVGRGRIDVALIAMHGAYGEDGTIQGLLEMFGVPYTGSGILASALGMDKIKTKEVLRQQRIPTADWIAINRRAWQNGRAELAERVGASLGFPCVVKANGLGSSVGISIVKDRAGFEPSMDDAFTHAPEVLAEAYIKGTEVTCAVLENPATGELDALPVTEIVPAGEFFDYHSKYTGETQEICPARITPEETRRVQDFARRTHEALGCRGFSRTDVIIRGEEMYVLELNSIPGMTEVSLLPQAAKAAGIEFSALLDRIIQIALK